MSKSFKEYKEHYLDLMQNDKNAAVKEHACSAIIAMMWQAGVDDINALPDAETEIDPEILAAEMAANTPLKEVMQNLKQNDYEELASSQEKLNTFYQTFKKHPQLQDPKVIEAENKRRELHNKGAVKQNAAEAPKPAEKKEEAPKAEEQPKRRVRKKIDPAEQERRRKEQEAKDLKSTQESMKNNAAGKEKRRSLILSRFGPDGKIKGTDDPEKYFTQEAAEKYNNTKLPVPEGLTPDMVAIIALGTAMDGTRYDFNKKMTQSGRPLEHFYYKNWNREFIYMSIIPGDDRSRDYSHIMENSREETKKALEAYQNHDFEPVKRSLKSFTDIIRLSVLDCDKSSRMDANHREYFRILNEMKDIPQLGVKEMFSEKEWKRIQVYAAQTEAADQFYQTASKMVNETPEAGSEERKKIAFDMLLNAGLMNAEQGAPDSFRKIDAMTDSLLNKIGRQFDPPMSGRSLTETLQEMDPLKASPELGQAILNLKQGYSENQIRKGCPAIDISPAQGYLSEPDGKQKLTELYKDAILKSDLYQKLVSEKDPYKLSKLVNQAKGSNFTKYREVELDDTKAKQMSDDSLSKEIEKNRVKDLNKVFAYKIGPKKLKEALNGLDSGTMDLFHNDSDEIKELREQTRLLRGMLMAKGEEALFDPDVKKTLKDTYKASVKYQLAKRTEAGADEADSSFQPKTPGGKRRYNAAADIEKYTKQFLDMEEIRKEAELELRQEEEQKIMQAKMKEQNKTFDGKSMGDKAVRAAMKEAKECFTPQMFLYEEKETKEIVGEKIAKVLAARTVAEASERAAQNGKKMKQADFNRYVAEVTQEVKNREDFKELMRSNSAASLVEAASTNNGKELMVKLTKARKTVDSRVQKNNAAEQNLNAERKTKKEL